MAIVGQNFYVNGVKVNDVLILPGQDFQIVGLPSNSDFAITVTNVDGAGLEGPPFAFPTTSTLQQVESDSPMSPADVAAIDGIVAAAMAADKQKGQMVSVTGFKGYLTKAYGSAGTRTLTVDDHFRMGSVTKTFIGTLILRQIGAGNLSLDDVLEDYVPGVPNGTTITIRQVMMMLSGVADYQTALGVTFTFNQATAYSPQQALVAIKAGPALSAPGAKYYYNNSNYVLLGFVLEALSDGTMQEQVASLIAEAALTDTKWPTTNKLDTPFSNGYGNNPLRSIPILGLFAPATIDQTSFNVPGLTGPAGALTTTIRDLHKWGKHLESGDLLTPEMHALRESVFKTYPQAQDVGTGPITFGYGLGYVAFGEWLGHDGSVPGFECATMYHPPTGTVISTMANFQTPALQVFLRTFHRIAEYLIPGSCTTTPTFTGPQVQPTARTLTITGGRPVISVFAAGTLIPQGAFLPIVGGTPAVTVSNNKLVVPTGAQLRILGGAPGFVPDPAPLTITGGRPEIIVNSFTPFPEENLDRIDRPVPGGCTGVWVTLIGGGGGGAGGWSANNANGGGGGGGAAKIFEVFIPVASLGSTYSCTRGVGGTGGALKTVGINGAATTFSSASVLLSAGGGFAGSPPGTATATGVGGAGGTTSISGVTATAASGTAGGNSRVGTGFDAVTNTNGGAAGGGGGGSLKDLYYNESGPGGATHHYTRYSGGKGGDTTTGTGAAANGKDAVDQLPGDPGPGGSGGWHPSSGTTGAAGGDGGDWGGGGGGGGRGAGGDGGQGYLMLRWV